jgi:hypothetical protein
MRGVDAAHGPGRAGGRADSDMGRQRRGGGRALGGGIDAAACGFGWFR